MQANTGATAASLHHRAGTPLHHRAGTPLHHRTGTQNRKMIAPKLVEQKCSGFKLNSVYVLVRFCTFFSQAFFYAKKRVRFYGQKCTEIFVDKTGCSRNLHCNKLYKHPS